MAFQALDSSKPRRRRNQTPAVYVYTVESRRSPGLVDVRIRLTKPLMEALGWNENQKVTVLVGSGEDEGQLLLQASNSGMFKFRRSTPTKSSFVLSSRNIPLPAGLKIRPPWELQEGGLLITWT